MGECAGTGVCRGGSSTGSCSTGNEFVVETKDGEKPFLQVAGEANYHRDRADEPERCEYFVPVDWLQTVPVAEAYREVGFFGNQNSVCKPTTSKWRHTIERLKQSFPKHAAR